MRVVIPVFEKTVISSVIGTMDILSMAGRFCTGENNKKEKPFFDVELAYVKENPVVVNGYPIICKKSIKSIRKTDLVIIPALGGDIPSQLEENKDLIKWLIKMYNGGATLVSLCTGAFLLASTGLLSGKSSTTHWVAKDLFGSMFPDVKLESENIIVDNGRLISSGGATSYLNMCIYLIEKYRGTEIANFSSKMFLIDKQYKSQNAFAILSTQKNHTDETILKVQDIIEQRPGEKFKLSNLAEMASLGERTFLRRFKRATGNSPIEYIKRARVEYAKRLLEMGTQSVSEVAYQSGYSDIDFFRKVFKQYAGINPHEYKKAYLNYDAVGPN